MLGPRLLIGPILIAALVGILVLDTRFGPAAPCLCVLAILLGVRSAWELVQLLRVRSFEPSLALVTACTVFVIAVNWLPRVCNLSCCNVSGTGLSALGPAMLAYSLSVMAVLARGCVRYREPGRTIETLGAELLIIAYAGILLSLTAQLRWVRGDALGYLPLGSLVVATKCGDIFAYTFGRLFGKKKLVPLLSPGKTWAGAWGALGGAAVGSVLFFQFVTPLVLTDRHPAAWYWAAIFGAVIGFAGLVGDLCESLIKRDVGQKDSAPLLPGFGGLLDILDSVIYAAPAAYVLWLILPLA